MIILQEALCSFPVTNLALIRFDIQKHQKVKYKNSGFY